MFTNPHHRKAHHENYIKRQTCITKLYKTNDETENRRGVIECGNNIIHRTKIRRTAYLSLEMKSLEDMF